MDYKIKNKFSINQRFAKDETFIGRERILGELVSMVRQNSQELRYCFTGLPKIGKTSIFQKLATYLNGQKDQEVGTVSVVVYITMDNYRRSETRHGETTEHTLLTVVAREIRNTLVALPSDLVEDSLKAHGPNVTSDQWLFEQRECLQEYLDFLSKSGIRILLLVDEFQRMPRFCTTQSEYCMLHNMNNLSIFCISRLPFSKVMDEFADSAAVNTYGLNVAQRTIHGFDDRDMDAYYSVFCDQYGCDISHYQPYIDYFCGRSPYMLSFIGQKLLQEIEKGTIDAVDGNWFSYNVTDRTIETHDEAAMNVMKLDKFRGLNNLERVCRVIFGPRVDIHKEDDNILVDMGLISTMAEIDALYDAKRYSVTPHFTEKLRREPITGELPTKMRHVEIMIKRMIRSVMADVQVDVAEAPYSSCCDDKGRREHIWTDEEKKVLCIMMKEVPSTLYGVKHFAGNEYKLYSKKKEMMSYANWMQPTREAGLLLSP